MSNLSDTSPSYDALLPQIKALVEGEPDLIANLANLAACLKEALPKASWVGFYLMRDGELVLGPFQGPVACTRIGVGRGVCGAAAERRRSIVVADVHAFEGHIACDSRAQSEIVVPILRGDEVLAVLDVDSHRPAAFGESDRTGLEQVAELAASLEWATA